MKALIQKELRELVKAAVLGLVILALFLLQDYHAYARAMRELALGGAGAGGYSPLAEGGLLNETFYFCAILGAVLGWLQIHNERRGDLWSFLVHRPVTRTQIFLAKIAAGAGLYVLAAGAPLAAFILWGIIPGHIAAPFEWAMLLPILARFLVGLVVRLRGHACGSAPGALVRQPRPAPANCHPCGRRHLPAFFSLDVHRHPGGHSGSGPGGLGKLSHQRLLPVPARGFQARPGCRPGRGCYGRRPRGVRPGRPICWPRGQQLLHVLL